MQTEKISFQDLLSDIPVDKAIEQGFRVENIALNLIDRYEFNRDVTDNDCKDLVEQLITTGWDLIQPVVVHPTNDRYQLIVGERRFKSFLIGKREYIKAIIRDDLTSQQIREMNLDENERRLDESFPSKCIRYKQYCDDFNVPQKVAAKRFKYGLSSFNDMVKYLYRINEIPEIKSLYDNGMNDKTTLKALIKCFDEDPEYLVSVIEFAKINNLISRDFLTKAIKEKPVDLFLFSQSFLADRKSDYNSTDDINNNDNSTDDINNNDNSTDDINNDDNSTDDINNDDNSINDINNDDNSTDDINNDANSTDDIIEHEGDSKNQLELSESSIKDNGKAILENLNGIAVFSRKPNKAELAFKYKGDVYFLEMDFLPQEEDKILLRNLRGEHILADKNECKIEYVS
jgi:ParB/RepB/Spo0J family partition protein